MRNKSILEKPVTGGVGPSPGGDTSEQTKRLNFAYGDVSPATIDTCPANGIVSQVEIIILTAFDGVGATLSVGDESDHESLAHIIDNDPKTVGTYLTTPGKLYGSGTSIKLYLVPGAGASAGNGVIVLTINP